MPNWILIAVTTLVTAGFLQARQNFRIEPAEAIDTEQTIFASGGIVELKESTGQVQIEGWDQSEVQVVVRKFGVERAAGELDRIVVTSERLSSNHMVITTRQPLRHRSDVRLIYQIKVPRQTRLVIEHDRGDVQVRNVTANMRVSNRIGRIDLSLPQNELYAIDAKTHTGQVASEWDNQDGCPGDMLEPVKLMLRVGTGNITLRRGPRA
jgi:hypothetical protein